VPALFGAACLLERPPRTDADGRPLSSVKLALGADRIETWLSPGPPSRALVVLLTGDGGWRGADRAIFDALASSGYPLAGLRAPGYLEHLSYEPTSAHRVAADVESLVRETRDALGLRASHPVVLVGFSRGAGLVIAAVGHDERERDPDVDGVVAVGLTEEEEYVTHHRHHARPEERQRPAPMLQPYQHIAEMGALPVAVIQSTGDGYLPADAARRLFGPDGPWRRFVAIVSRNHTFSDARDELTRQVTDAVAWVVAGGSGPAA
jgi:pimeloyl-ACP methyl ester carboxylesterase